MHFPTHSKFALHLNKEPLKEHLLWDLQFTDAGRCWRPGESPCQPQTDTPLKGDAPDHPPLSSIPRTPQLSKDGKGSLLAID